MHALVLAGLCIVVHGACTSSDRAARGASRAPVPPIDAGTPAHSAAAPSEPETDQPPASAWVNSDACPEPWQPFTDDPIMIEYEAFVQRALHLPPQPDELIVVHSSPAFSPDQTLALVQRADQSYALRSTRLTEHVYYRMREQMEQLERSGASPAAAQAEALARIAATPVVREQPLDGRTAQLFLELWRALVARGQVVREIGAGTGIGDGISYRIWSGGKIVETNIPAEGSVLGRAISALERLRLLIDRPNPSVDADLERAIARRDMDEALQRTRLGEPCLRPYRPRVSN